MRTTTINIESIKENKFLLFHSVYRLSERETLIKLSHPERWFTILLSQSRGGPLTLIYGNFQILWM